MRYFPTALFIAAGLSVLGALILLLTGGNDQGPLLALPSQFFAQTLLIVAAVLVVGGGIIAAINREPKPIRYGHNR